CCSLSKHGCAWANGDPRSSRSICLPACPVAEAADDFAAGYRMKLQRFHEMVGSDVPAQGSVISAEHLVRSGRGDGTRSPVAASVKQQRCAWLDTDMSYGKEHRAGGLTVGVDPKALA